MMQQQCIVGFSHNNIKCLTITVFSAIMTAKSFLTYKSFPGGNYVKGNQISDPKPKDY